MLPYVFPVGCRDMPRKWCEESCSIDKKLYHINKTRYLALYKYTLKLTFCGIYRGTEVLLLRFL